MEDAYRANWFEETFERGERGETDEDEDAAAQAAGLEEPTPGEIWDAHQAMLLKWEIPTLDLEWSDPRKLKLLASVLKGAGQPLWKAGASGSKAERAASLASFVEQAAETGTSESFKWVHANEGN